MIVWGDMKGLLGGCFRHSYPCRGRINDEDVMTAIDTIVTQYSCSSLLPNTVMEWS